MSKDTIFLSGWEYNRILAESPFQNLASALPAQCLWNGSAQFWLFDKVYCFKEAFDVEVACYDALGWTTGRIFQDLKSRGFLEVKRWEELVADDELRKALAKEHHDLKAEYSREHVLSLLKNGQEDELEMIKLRLLSPVFTKFNCFQNISPNSIRVWAKRDYSPESQAGKMFKLIADPLIKHSRKFQLGLPLCRPPGTGLPRELAAQQQVEQTVQKPLIPSLLAGELSHKDYLAALTPTAQVYKPIDEQLLRDYKANIDNLQRVKDEAEKHIWPLLHGEWLPRLEVEPGFAYKIGELVDVAVQNAGLAPYLKFVTNWGVNAISFLGGTLAEVGLQGAGGGYVLGGSFLAGGVLNNRLQKERDEKAFKAHQLTLFYQSLISS